MTKNHPKIEFWKEELQSWKPSDRIYPSEWAEKYIVLGDYAEEKGPFRIRRAPYLGPIMNAFYDSNIEEVVFQASAQIGKTTVMLAIGGYYAHQEPCPIYFVLADAETSEYMCRERFQPIFDDSPELSHLKSGLWNRDEMRTTNGAYVAFGWASSVMKLGSKSFRVLMMDEIDKPGYYVTTKEASALSLAEERKETFFRFKIMKCSTPTIDTGNIVRSMSACDVVYDWHAECPFCHQKQPLRWSRKYSTGFPKGLYRSDDGRWRRLGEVVWKGGRKATEKQIARAGYKCGNCGKVWNTAQKNVAVERGEMVPRSKPLEIVRKVGFHCNRLYSLLGKSGDIPKLVRAFIDARKSGDPKNLQGFVNSTLGEEWRETVKKPEIYEILKAKCDLEPQTVPQTAIALTCGIDVQKYGFWYVVRAWESGYTSWLIHYGHLGAWDDVENLLFRTRYPIDGKSATAGIWRAAIDTGGGDVYEDMASMTEQTYWFIRQNGVGRGCRVWGSKGSAIPLSQKVRPGSIIDKTPKGKPLKSGFRLMLIDTDKCKDMVHYRLNQAVNREHHAAYLHKDTDEIYAKQVTAEEKRIDDKGRAVWVQVATDNHLLDCEVLAHACAEPEWDGGGLNILAPVVRKEPVPEKKTVKPSQPKSTGRW